MPNAIITARRVAVDLGGVPVLRDVDLTAAPGEIVAVMGENGAGKSTLLRCLAGLQPSPCGEIDVLGGPPADLPGFWREVALAGDEPAWYPGLSVREHLELMGAVRQDARLTAGEALATFELSARADLAPLSLSTGQRQRLSLAMALLRSSRLLLLDEPERGLDAAFRRRLAGILRGYAAEGGAVVMATHDARLAQEAGARVVTLRAAS
ncbi:heme ABC exporter ATP-binding protein CcmA [Microbispora cellulosiformans]|uniref:Heme ABC exporter ATP-binding protein CcmA n=1 Tax=Microbispora cellulosiformans TaxID=2614688 RepID=A0A5J5K6I6_9ACTN|nr:heme ABC exporter ATP-binding protein CcmA [Microbispora cellulosiformans]KAA9380410.1 heme ABC exporter ATP-binding protein CcmA [Microbispora cellulosiformans]